MSRQTNNRNGVFGITKFVYCIAIALFHVAYFADTESTSSKFFPRGYILTDFFFVIAGFFLAIRCYRDEFTNEEDLFSANVRYIFGRIKHYMPYIFPAHIMGLAVKFWFYGGSLYDLIISIWDVLLLRIWGFNTYVVNYPIWYISAMIIGIFMIYPFLCKYKDKYTLYFAPLISLILFGYLANTYDSLNLVTEFNAFISAGVLRGIAELNLGIVCYYVSQEIKKNNFSNLSLFLLSIVEGFSFLIPLIHLINARDIKKYEYIFLLLYAVGISISGSGKTQLSKFFNNKCIFYLERLSLPIYVNQFFIRILLGNTFNLKFTNYYLRSMNYLIVLILFSIIEMHYIDNYKIN